MIKLQEVKDLFDYAHLPDGLYAVSKPFHDLAVKQFKAFGPSEYTTAMLFKLWEAKNLAVWLAANE